MEERFDQFGDTIEALAARFATTAIANSCHHQPNLCSVKEKDGDSVEESPLIRLLGVERGGSCSLVPNNASKWKALDISKFQGCLKFKEFLD